MNPELLLLLAAIRQGRETDARRLLAAVDDPNAAHGNETPLSLAAGHLPALIPALVQAGARVEERLPHPVRRTAVFQAVHPESVRALVAAGASLAQVDRNGQGVVAALLTAPVPPGQPDRRVDAVEAALALGAPVNGANRLGLTPLMYAAKSTDLAARAVPLLLDAGAAIDATDRQGSPAVCHAACHGTAALEILLDTGASRERLEATLRSPECGWSVKTRARWQAWALGRTTRDGTMVLRTCRL